MRIRKIIIGRWRHFEGIEFSLPVDAPIVCLVGANGTGKSQILELISACAQKIGLSPGFENSRGNPFDEDAQFEIVFQVPIGTIPLLDKKGPYTEAPDRDDYLSWDRTLTLRYVATRTFTILAGGVAEERAINFGGKIVSLISNSSSVHYLALDADRAYPKVQIMSHQLGEVYEKNWTEASNKSSSFKITRNLYEEWFRYFLGKENQQSTQYIQQVLTAKSAGEDQPAFVDQFESYKDSIKRVLRHLTFIGIDSQSKQIRFDSTGVSLSFDQLSGGEREIAFLVGQIDRFGLKRGLLLVDEPELHLNNDLLRTWVGFLRDSVQEGQIWLATHSLEVVEVTGRRLTVSLERDEVSRRVNKAQSLAEQPILASLSRVIGTPAFSISNTVFLFIEGEEELGERERFNLITGSPSKVRFLPGGPCKEVIRKVGLLQTLSENVEQPIRVGGVVDRDWRTPDECLALKNQGLYVLEVHEIENLYLHPQTVKKLLNTIGGDSSMYEDMLIQISDGRAGSWIFNSARTRKQFQNFPEPSKAVRELVYRLTLNDFAEAEQQCNLISARHGGLDQDQIAKFSAALQASLKIYERRRASGETWKICEGKEVFRSIVREIGFSDEEAAERAIVAVWARNSCCVPRELAELRSYVYGLLS